MTRVGVTNEKANVKIEGSQKWIDGCNTLKWFSTLHCSGETSDEAMSRGCARR